MTAREDSRRTELYASNIAEVETLPVAMDSLQSADNTFTLAAFDSAYEMAGSSSSSSSGAAVAPRQRQSAASSKDWWGLTRQRMWTKMDFLHIHAVSGVAFSGLGTVWVSNYLSQVTESFY
jgi:hypothetical protein